MTDWVQLHKDSIQFLLFMTVGVTFIVVGMFNGREPAMIALGGGAIGLPGFADLAKKEGPNES